MILFIVCYVVINISIKLYLLFYKLIMNVITVSYVCNQSFMGKIRFFFTIYDQSQISISVLF